MIKYCFANTAIATAMLIVNIVVLVIDVLIISIIIVCGLITVLDKETTTIFSSALYRHFAMLL
jgi:hypothetical protein